MSGIVDRTLLSCADAGERVSILDRSRCHNTWTKRCFNGDGVPGIRDLGGCMLVVMYVRK